MRNYDVYSQNCPTRLVLDHIADIELAPKLRRFAFWFSTSSK